MVGDMECVLHYLQHVKYQLVGTVPRSNVKRGIVVFTHNTHVGTLLHQHFDNSHRIKNFYLLLKAARPLLDAVPRSPRVMNRCVVHTVILVWSRAIV